MCSATDLSEQHFTGQIHDQETGNDYFNARYYSTSAGRFLSPDWNSDPDTVPYADYTDPQTLNLYSYGGNNPLINTDVDGHDYYLQGGSQCRQNGIDCDQEGYVLIRLEAERLSRTKHSPMEPTERAREPTVESIFRPARARLQVSFSTPVQEPLVPP